MGSSNNSIPVHSVETPDNDQEFKFQIEINKLEKSVLLKLPNSEYQNLQNSYQHLKDIKIIDNDKKRELHVHLILAVDDYTKIKAQDRSRMGLAKEPITKLAKLCWVFLIAWKRKRFN